MADNFLSISYQVSVKPVLSGSQKVAVGWEHPHRVIDNYELIFLRKGGLEIYEGDQVFKISSGETLILYPNIHHGAYTPISEETLYYWLHFRIVQEGVDESMKDISESMKIPRIKKVDRPEVLSDLLTRHISWQADGDWQRVSQRLLLMLILAEVAYTPAKTHPKGKNILATLAMDYIIHHPVNISTIDIARAIGCNPDYLGRRFKECFGMTITEAMVQRRIILAKQQLHEFQMPVFQIARRCGFQDSAYFCRFFKQHTGMTPMEYRRDHSKQQIAAANWLGS